MLAISTPRRWCAGGMASQGLSAGYTFVNSARCRSSQGGSWRERLASEPLVVRIPDLRRVPGHAPVSRRPYHREQNVGLVVVLALVVGLTVLLGSPRLEPLRTTLARYLTAQQDSPSLTAEAHGERMPILPVQPLIVRTSPEGSGAVADQQKRSGLSQTGAALQSDRPERREWR